MPRSMCWCACHDARWRDRVATATSLVSAARPVPSAAAADAALSATAAAATGGPRQKSGILEPERQAGRAQGRVQRQPHCQRAAAADQRPPRQRRLAGKFIFETPRCTRSDLCRPALRSASGICRVVASCAKSKGRSHEPVNRTNRLFERCSCLCRSRTMMRFRT